MAGSKVNDYSIGDQNIQSVMLTLDKAFKGFHQVSLTNYNTTSKSAIAAGSVVEVNGALYKFDSDESITESPSDGTVYIYLVPSGDTVTAAYTNTAPTWSDSKQGWYGTGGNANYRYLEFVLIKGNSVWLLKDIFKSYFIKYGELRIQEYQELYEIPLITYQNSASTTSGTSEKILYDSKTYDYFSLLNISTGKFTAQKKATYLLEITFDYVAQGTNASQWNVYKNGSSFYSKTLNGTSSVNYSANISLVKNDYVEIYIAAGIGLTLTSIVFTITMQDIFEI